MFQVPVIGGRGYIIPHMAIYTTYNIITTYILPIGGLYATYHLLREPETTIEGISPRKSSFQIGCPTPVPAIRWPQSWRFLRCHSGWCWSLHPSRVNELSSIRQRLLSKDYIYMYIYIHNCPPKENWPMNTILGSSSTRKYCWKNKSSCGQLFLKDVFLQRCFGHCTYLMYMDFIVESMKVSINIAL